MVLRVGAELLEQRGVHEVGVAQVAVQEGAEDEAVVVGELLLVEERMRLRPRPALDVLAADEVQNAPLRVLALHHD